MLKEIHVPDIGNFSDVDIIEVLIKPNDRVIKEMGLITLETAKATLEVPSPLSGVIKTVNVKVGDKVSKGSLIASVEVEEAKAEAGAGSKAEEGAKGEAKEAIKAGAESAKTAATQDKKAEPEAKHEAAPLPPTQSSALSPVPQASGASLAKPSVPPEGPVPPVHKAGFVHAGPKAREFARELGVNLQYVRGSGEKGRIIISDIKAYVKQMLSKGGGEPAQTAGLGGITIAPWPDIDHAKFGPITKEPLPRLRKLSGAFLLRNWVRIPHVTQFDEADITELEQFRKEEQKLAETEGFKLTPLAFIMKAVVAALKAFPLFNTSLEADGITLVYKEYFHIGVAVDTPNGLVVPVLRDVDQKGVFQLAKELGEISKRARDLKLSAEEMQGSSFTITSLGGIGGTAFTPIINVPDVAILGVSKAQMKPVFKENEFKPRLMLPLSLSYDHRVIDGALGARFTSFLVEQLADIRRLLL